MNKILLFIWPFFLILIGLIGFGCCVLSVIYSQIFDFISTPLGIVIVGYLSVIIFFLGIRSIYKVITKNKDL